jgi:CheY-like chemotaxis protein
MSDAGSTPRHLAATGIDQDPGELWRIRRHAFRQPVNALSLYAETLRLKLQGSGHEPLIDSILAAAAAIEAQADALFGLAEVQARSMETAKPGSPRSFAAQDVLSGSSDPSSATSPATKVPPEVSPLGDVSIIVVDDDPAARLGVQLLLETWGAEVRVLSGLAELERFLAADPGAAPDLVMIDYHLPRPGQGLDALNRLRQHWRADLPAVLVTGDDRAALSNALYDGRMACLVKPVSPQPLLAALQGQLGR